MSAWGRALLIVEAMLCFGPVTYFWFASFAAIPFSLMAFFSGNGVTSLVLPLFTLLGSFGLLGAVTLFSAIDQDAAPINVRKLFFHLACGATACIGVVVLVGGMDWEVALLFLAPILATLHFLYLCRRHLMPVKKSVS